MAIQWKVNRMARTGGDLTAEAPRNVGSRVSVLFDCYPYDDGEDPVEPVEPALFTEYDVLQLPEFPIVNEALFISEDVYGANETATTRVWPWMPCVGKRALRDTRNRLLFHVNIDYATLPKWEIDERDLAGIPIPATVDDYPFLRETLWGEYENVIWEATSGGSNDFRLPTGQLYSEPFMSRYPQRTYRQHQFENLPSTPEQAVEDRLFTTCSDDLFEGVTPTPGTGDPNPPRWLMRNIGYQYMEIPIDNSGAPGEIKYEPTHMMVYDMDRNPKDGGWMDRRGLIDKYVLLQPNDLSTKTAYVDKTDGATIVNVLLNTDGTERPTQTGAPTFLNYQVQRTLPWKSFIKEA